MAAYVLLNTEMYGSSVCISTEMKNLFEQYNMLKLNSNVLSWSWLYGSWIYYYMCNQCLSSLTLWVRIPIMARCIAIKLSVTCDRWFSPGTPVWPPRYNWNIVESGVKHHNHHLKLNSKLRNHLSGMIRKVWKQISFRNVIFNGNLYNIHLAWSQIQLKQIINIVRLHCSVRKVWRYQLIKGENRRRTGNSMAKRTSIKGQTMT